MMAQNTAMLTKDIECVSADISAFFHASIYRATAAGICSETNHTKSIISKFSDYHSI